jgi:signal transduction histidine kinase
MAGWPTVATLVTVGPPLLASVVVTWLAVRLFQRERAASGYTDLVRPYTWLCLVFGAAIAVTGLIQLRANAVTASMFALALPFFLVWNVFALGFAGRGHLVTRERIVAGGALCVGVGAMSVLGSVVVADPGPLLQALTLGASVLSLGILAVVMVVGGLVVLSTYRHRSLSTIHGVVVVLPVVLLVSAIQLTRPSLPAVNDVILSVLAVTVAGTLVLAVSRYEVLDVRPGAATAPERSTVRGIDDAVLTVERDGRLARANETAEALFGDRLGERPLADLLETDVAALADRETLECWTTNGRRQFDPRVTALTNRYDETVGYLVALIDVTDREIRRQRLEVLNRILRHNVRNELDVVRAHAEDADLTPAIQGVDRLERLSEETRRVQQLMERSADDRTRTELSSLIDDIVADVTAGTNAEVTVTMPNVTVTLDRELCRYAVRQLVENAVEHNDGAVPHVVVRGEHGESDVRIVVADDGPGIPESERAVIEVAEESPLKHASSFGLWGTNWAIRAMGGSLSFGDSDLGGTAVIITLPDAVIPDPE